VYHSRSLTGAQKAVFPQPQLPARTERRFIQPTMGMKSPAVAIADPEVKSYVNCCTGQLWIKNA
jgi:hypothetical protein